MCVYLASCQESEVDSTEVFFTLKHTFKYKYLYHKYHYFTLDFNFKKSC